MQKEPEDDYTENDERLAEQDRVPDGAPGIQFGDGLSGVLARRELTAEDQVEEPQNER